MTPLAVVAGVIIRDGCVFISKRPQNKARGGLWEFPGGKIETGEAPEEALVRELKEELGIEVRVKNIYDAKINAYPDRTVLVLFYECEITEGEPTALEAEEIAWVAPKDITKYDFAQADKPVAARIKENANA